MNAFKQLFMQISEEIEVISLSSFHHKLLGEFALGTTEVSNKNIGIEGQIPQGLWVFIYHYYYLGNYQEAKSLRDEQRPSKLMQDLEDRNFTKQLQEANTGTGYYAPGWLVESITPSHLYISKDGVRLKASFDEVSASPTSISCGDFVSVRFPKDVPYASPGHYIVIGNEGASNPKHGLMVRLYFNISPLAAPELVAHVTQIFNRFQIPFQFKILNNPKKYDRRDTAVLYLNSSNLQICINELSTISSILEPAFNNEVPSFTKPLRKGISIAEEPNLEHWGTLSFGQHRSWLIAEGLVAAWDKTKNEPYDRFVAIKERYQQEGIDLRTPYCSQSINIDSLIA